MLIVDIIGQFHMQFRVTGQKMSSLSLPRRKSGGHRVRVFNVAGT